MGENERLTNGTVSMTVLESMAEHILDHDCLAAGGSNTSEMRSILEVLEGRTKLHKRFSQSSYYGDPRDYHSWNHGIH